MRHVVSFTTRVSVLLLACLLIMFYTYSHELLPAPSRRVVNMGVPTSPSEDVLPFGVVRYMKLVQSSLVNETAPGDMKHSETLKSKVRVLCLILTMDQNFQNRAMVVKGTWAKRCNSFFFVMNTPRTASYIINSPYVENRHNIIHKVKFALKYIYDHHIDDFDWLLKADDDTYVIMENLRHLLNHYDSHVPGYLGYHFKKFVDNGYMSGGAGYVMSKSALQAMVDRGFDTGACAVIPNSYDPENSEDLEIGKCMNKSGVSVLRSLDSANRETFHPYPMDKHLFGPLEPYLYQWSSHLPRVGPGCCSRFSISFHYVKPETMILMDHLLYHTSVYGHDNDIVGHDADLADRVFNKTSNSRSANGSSSLASSGISSNLGNGNNDIITRVHDADSQKYSDLKRRTKGSRRSNKRVVKNPN